MPGLIRLYSERSFFVVFAKKAILLKRFMPGTETAMRQRKYDQRKVRKHFMRIQVPDSLQRKEYVGKSGAIDQHVISIERCRGSMLIPRNPWRKQECQPLDDSKGQLVSRITT